jgi:hypothetical protein
MIAKLTTDPLKNGSSKEEKFIGWEYIDEEKSGIRIAISRYGRNMTIVLNKEVYKNGDIIQLCDDPEGDWRNNETRPFPKTFRYNNDTETFEYVSQFELVVQSLDKSFSGTMWNNLYIKYSKSNSLNFNEAMTASGLCDKLQDARNIGKLSCESITHQSGQLRLQFKLLPGDNDYLIFAKIAEILAFYPDFQVDDLNNSESTGGSDIIVYLSHK